MMKKGNKNSVKDASSKPCTILVVEDDKGLARLIAKSLKNTGFDAGVACNGVQAVDLVVNNPVNLMLLDYKLPDMSARQVVETIKERKIEIPFIIMTGHGDEKVAVEMMKTGARDYIVKEGKFFELLPSVVKRVFEELQSEKKLIEASEALVKSEKEYRSLVDNALVGIYKININGEILYVNRALSNMFEYASPEEMMSGNILKIFKNTNSRKTVLDRLNTSGSLEEVECQCITKNGNNIAIIVSATLNGDVVSGMAINITSRKKMEKILIQTEKLRAMGVMAAGIAHDFNNVLAIIDGHAQLLENSCDENEELVYGLRAITKAVEDGSETVRRLSEFTRTEMNASKDFSVNFIDIIKQSVDFLKPKWKDAAHAGGITYAVDIAGMAPVRDVLGKPSELREVVINMINNAIDAMPEGGCLTFRTWERENTVLMSIADNGCGMSQEVQAKIFDPFYTTKGVEGSGLGMSISYGIITKYGGKIDVTSQVGEGTVFTIELPVAAKTIFPEASHVPEINIDADSFRILVVDDIKEISGILHMFLSRQGYNVDKVENGAEAIKLLENECYDLIICDLGMPEISGWDIIKTIETLDKKPKIGLITGWADMLDSLEKDDMGVDFIISKPIQYKKLSTLVKKTLLKQSQETVEDFELAP